MSLISGEPSVQSASIGTTWLASIAAFTFVVSIAVARLNLQVGHQSAEKSTSTVAPSRRRSASRSLEKGWHLYSLTQGKQSAKPTGPKATAITVAADSPQVPAAGFVPDHEPEVRTVENVPSWKGLTLEEHHGTVTWRAPLVANPAGTAAQMPISIVKVGTK